MFRQGDREKTLGQPVSPLMDRVKGGVTKSQTGFFNIVALPMYTVGRGPANVPFYFSQWLSWAVLCFRRLTGPDSVAASLPQTALSTGSSHMALHAQAFAQVFPSASEMLVNLLRNFDHWSAVEAAATKQQGHNSRGQ